MTENVYIVSVIVNCIFRKRRYSKFLVQEFQNVSVETSIRTSKFSKIIPSHSEDNKMQPEFSRKEYFNKVECTRERDLNSISEQISPPISFTIKHNRVNV